MTDTPERICIGQFRGLAKSLQGVAMDTDDECDATICRDASSAMMEAATALEAAQARIAELEAMLTEDVTAPDLAAEVLRLRAEVERLTEVLVTLNGPDWEAMFTADEDW